MRCAAALLTIAATLFGCRTTPPAPPDLGPFDNPARAPRGETAVIHGPGACALCDLHYRVRPSVLRIRTEHGEGAGVIIDARGYAVTTARIVGGSTVVDVDTPRGASTIARVVHRNPKVDFAVLALAPIAEPWIPLAFATDVEPRAGDDVYVIGHPSGLGWSVNRGRITGRRPAGDLAPIPMLQTDAVLSPGAAGGPLIDGDGRVIGIVTARPSDDGRTTVAFVIPGAVARELARPHLHGR